jgi:hypothetical protein
MKQTISLPTRFSWIGLAVFVPFAILGFMNLYHEFEFPFLAFRTHSNGLFSGNQNLTDELALTGCIIGLLMMSFARTKNEDEFIMSLRLQAWQWAVLAHFVFLLLGIWLVYDMQFFYFMVYNMLTVLIIFNLRFRYLMIRNASAND